MNRVLYRALLAGPPMSVLQRLQAQGALTFFKDYANEQDSANADYSVGSETATVTAARSASAPATYFDAAGALLTLTTANVPRWTAGFYDSTGFHARPGVMVESGGSATTGQNILTKSSAFEHANWTKTNGTASDAEADGVLTTTVSSFTATAGDATLTQAVVSASSKYTASVFIKRKTGTGTISLRANTADGYTDITANVGAGWTRIPVTSTSAANPTFDLKLSTSGDAVYIYAAQLERFPYATSYIPTDTAARTRAAETLAYATAGNCTAAAETIFAKITPLGSNFANDSVQRTIYATAADVRLMAKTTTAAVSRMVPNSTGSSSVFASGTTSLVAGNSYVVAGGANLALPKPFVSLSVAGTREASWETLTTWTQNTFGATFAVGSLSAGSSQLNGIVESLAIYGEYKDVPYVNAISALLDSSVVTATYEYVPAGMSSANVISGSTTGNVETNAKFASKGNLVRTGADTILMVTTIGSDSELSAATERDIVLRTFTISTQTWSAESSPVYTFPVGYAGFSKIVRIVGTQLYIYITRRPVGGPTDEIVLFKSTDLTGTTWDAGTVVYTPVPDGQMGVLTYIEDIIPGTDYMFGMFHNFLMVSTDGGETFTKGATIPNRSGLSESATIRISGDRLITVLRDEAGNYILQQNATINTTTGALTWGSVVSTGVGDIGGGLPIKVTPRLLAASDAPGYLSLYFYDRSDARLRIISPIHEEDAWNNNWGTAYAMGTNGWGNMYHLPYDDDAQQYLCTNFKETVDVPPKTTLLWWVWRDKYEWVEV